MSTRRQWIASVVFTLAFSWFCLRCFPQAKPVQDPTVRIGYLTIIVSLPLFVAEEKGFFQAEGIKVQSVPIASSRLLAEGMVSGTLDVFPNANTVPILAEELQVPGRIKIFSLSDITKEAPFDAILVRETSGLKNLADLAGKKISVHPGSAAALLRKYFADKGIDTSAITFVPMSPQEQLNAGTAGSVDAIHTLEPTVAIALSVGGFRRLFGSIFAEILSPSPQGVAAVSAGFLQAHPQEAIKTLRALERAMRFMRENDRETRQILCKKLGLSADAGKSVVLPYMIPHDRMNAGILQRYADLLTQIGELKTHVKTDAMIYSAPGR